MAGLKMVIPTTFTDNSLAVLRDDELLPSAGALLLLDATHSAGSWPAGVPTAGTLLTNIAATQATALTGDPLKAIVETNYTSANMIVERTSKGGLHTMPSSAAGYPANTYFRLNMPAALRNYLFANMEHDFYFSQWTRHTRNSGGSGAPMNTGAFHKNSGTYLAALWRSGATLGSYPGGGFGTAELLGSRVGALTPGTATHQSLGVNSWVGTNPAAATEITTMPYASGSTTAVTPAATFQLPALALYRVYLEDLTVSGRTYAQVDALDNQLFTDEVQTAGGRYYGDTYTTPSN